MCDYHIFTYLCTCMSIFMIVGGVCAHVCVREKEKVSLFLCRSLEMNGASREELEEDSAGIFSTADAC